MGESREKEGKNTVEIVIILLLSKNSKRLKRSFIEDEKYILELCDNNMCILLFNRNQFYEKEEETKD